jgi:hypothetical protein
MLLRRESIASSVLLVPILLVSWGISSCQANPLNAPPTTEAAAICVKDQLASAGKADSIESKAAVSDPNLYSAVHQAELAGASGKWFSSTSPFSLDGKPQYFYELKKVPATTNPDSPFLMLRFEHSRKMISELIDSGVPIVVGSIPSQKEVYAAALGDHYLLAKDALQSTGVTDHHNVILIQPTVDPFVLSHEHQHWVDFENTRFDQAVSDAIAPFIKKGYFTAEQSKQLLRTVIEIRGHAAEAKAARKGGLQKEPYLNAGGNVVLPHDSRLPSLYDAEESRAASVFMQEYQMPLVFMTVKIRENKDDYTAFLQALSKFDFSDDPDNRFLKFARILPPPM